MWSLPDIKALNAKAVKEYEENKNLNARDLLKGKECDDCNKKAAYVTAYHDVFSDKPKGYIFLCDEHYKNYGPEPEGYFLCEGCERLHIKNYTWENYFTEGECGLICLNCALDSEIASDGNTITRNAAIDKIDFDFLREAKHLIPNSGTYWKKHLDFHGNAEFDSMSGKSISGGGIEGLKDILKKALTDDNKKALLILDSDYQFAVSIGVYTLKI